jgi:hypothetical protein
VVLVCSLVTFGRFVSVSLISVALQLDVVRCLIKTHHSNSMTFVSRTKIPPPVHVPVDAVSQFLNVKHPFGLLWCVELCASFTHNVRRLVSDALKASCQDARRVLQCLFWHHVRMTSYLSYAGILVSDVSKDKDTVVLRNVANCSAVNTA